MNKEKILLSIVIPTKNRYTTLIPTINAIINNLDDLNYEIVVQDNSDAPVLLRDYLIANKDSRINYAHTKGALSVVENTEYALSRANGEFITFIGDDDLVSPNIIECVRELSFKGVESIIYDPAYYWWDTIVFNKKNKYNHPCALWYPSNINTNTFVLDTKYEYKKSLSAGGASMFDLPRVYHGVIHRSVLERIKKITGKYVCGASPDMALAVAAAHVLQWHVKINIPLTIYGASKNSGGGWTATNKHYGSIDEQKHLPQSTKDNWSEYLPKVWSEHTIYPQTIEEVLRYFKSTEKINYNAFYASMLINEPHLRKVVLPFILNNLKRSRWNIGLFAIQLIIKTGGKIVRYVKSTYYGFPYELKILNTPDECMNHIKSKLKS